MPLNVGGSNSLYWKTGLDLKGLKSGVAGAKGIIAGFAKNISAMDVFAGLAIGATLAFKKIADEAYQFSKDFEHAMKEVQTISQAVTDDFEGMSDAIIEMSKVVPESALSLTKGLYQIVSAGNDGAEALDILRTSAELAVAGVTDTQTAAEGITFAMNAFGESAGTASDVADNFFTTVKLAVTKMEQLGPAVSRVAGLWAQVGGSFEDLMTTFAVGGRTLKTEILGTGIRGILTSILSPSEDAIKVVKELGLEFDAASFQAKGFRDFLIDLMEATDGNKETLARLFPNVRGLIGILAVAQEGGEKFAEALEKMQTNAGAASKAFGTMVSDTKNQLVLLSNNVLAKLEPLGKSINKWVGDVARGFNETLSKSSNAFTNLANEQQDMLDIFKERKGVVSGYIKEIEELNKAQEEGKDVAVELNAAEEALATLMPEVASAIDKGTTSIDLLAVAKNNMISIDREILEMEKEIIDTKLEAARLDLEIYYQGKSPSQKKIENLDKQIKRMKEAKEILTGGTTFSLYGAVYIPDKQKEISKDLLLLEKKLAIATREKALEVKKYTNEIERLELASRGITGALAVTPKPPPPGGGGGGGPNLAEIERLDKLFQSWLEAHRTTEEEIQAIRDYYRELRKAEDADDMVERINLAEEEAIAKVRLREQEEKEKQALAELGLKNVHRMNRIELKDYIKTLQEKLKGLKEFGVVWEAIYKKIGLAQSELWSQEKENIRDIAGAITGIGQMFGGEIGRVLGGIGDIVSTTSRGITAAGAVGIIGSTLEVFNTIRTATNSIAKDTERLEKLTKKIRDNLKDAARLVSITTGSEQEAAKIQELEKIQEGIVELKKEELDIINDINDAFAAQYRPKGYEQRQQALADNLRDEIKDLETEYTIKAMELQALLAATTSKSISTSIISGFEEGKRGIEDFAQTFEDLMKNAMKEVFKRQIISKYLEQWAASFAMYTESGGGLSEFEIMLLRGEWDKIIGDAETQWKTMEDFWKSVGFSGSDVEQTGLAGAIKGITEETAGVLAGQMHAIILDTEVMKGGVQAMDINLKSMVDISENVLLINTKIEQNTRRSADILESRTSGSAVYANTQDQHLRAIGG